MYNHDFKKGDIVYTLADPSFERPLKVLSGTVVRKWTSPRGDEHAYDILHSNGIVYENIPGIHVYASLDDLHDAVMNELVLVVDFADMVVNYYTQHLEDAKHNKERLQRMLQEWRQSPHKNEPDAQGTWKPVTKYP